ASLTVSGTINVADNATVSIPAAGTTLSYSGDNLTIGAHTLAIGGAGTFSNASDSPLVLTSESSYDSVSFLETLHNGQGPSQTQKTKWSNFISGLSTDDGWDKVTFRGSLDQTGKSCDDPAIVSSLINYLNGSGSSFTNQTCNGDKWSTGSCGGKEITVGASSSVCNCNSNYTIRVGISHKDWGGIGGSTCSAPTQSLEIIFEGSSEQMTASSILDLTGSGTISGPIRLEDGTLKASGSPTISGDITQYDNAAIEVASGQTLNYSGASIGLGANELTLIGGGTFNNSNALVLNNADSLLALEGIGTIGNVKATANANSSKGLHVSSSAALGQYDVSAVGYLEIAASQTLSGQLNLQSGGELNISGSGEYTGDIELAGGKFSATDDQTLSGTLSITADSELAVSEDHTLTLSQTGGLSLGGNTLTLIGGGTLQSGGLKLNNASSKLLLNSITVDSVSTSADSLGLKIDDNSTISSLSVSNLTPVSITDGKSLSGGITVNTGGTVQLADNGTLASNISMNGGKLDADNSLTISGAVTSAGDFSIDVASGKTITFDNGTISTENYQLTLEGAGTIAFPDNASGIVVNNAAGLLKLNGTGTLGAAQVTAVSNTGKGLSVNASSTISNLKVAANTELNVAADKTLSGAVEVAENKTLTLSGTGTLGSTLNLEGTLEAGASLTVSGTIN
ncbi:MAG: hypothetical protein NZ837_08085, partial [Gammaproteobacteria bacterium]|nr:hypothetical protein [Gammaproteobacteria bacterium]